MKAVTFSDARKHFKDTCDAVCADHAPQLVTRKNGESVVIMSAEDYEAMQETLHLLGSPKNAERLLEALEQIESGKGVKKGLIDE